MGAADVSEDKLRKFHEKVNQDAFITTDYRELLKQDDIDAVAILSPDYLHEEHAIAALEAGKHVYCEKPLAITVEGCDRIIETAKRVGKHLMVGFNMRYMNMYQTMKGIVDSGILGDLKAVWVRHFVGYGGISIITTGTVQRKTRHRSYCRKVLMISMSFIGLLENIRRKFPHSVHLIITAGTSLMTYFVRHVI